MECDKDPEESAMECILESGKTAIEMFDDRFSNIIIEGKFSELNMIPVHDAQTYNDYIITDRRYIDNPACDTGQFPQWRGEHVFQLSDKNCNSEDMICLATEEYYGHNLGVRMLGLWYLELSGYTDPDLEGDPIILDKAIRLDYLGLMEILLKDSGKKGQ